MQAPLEIINSHGQNNMDKRNHEQRKSLTGQAVIIAAGESSRFWPLNQNHKSQTYLLGKPLIYWTLKGLAENGVQDVIVVHAKESSLPSSLQKENDLGVKISYVLQEEPLGTGNAVWQAREFIREPFLVVWPNKVNAEELVKKILEQKKTTGSQVVLLGAQTQTPWDYGVARMEGERVAEIMENPEKGKEPSNIKVIGLYSLEPDFFLYYEKLSRHHEADFMDGINSYLKEKKSSLVLLDKDVPALKYPWELFGILDILFASENFQHFISSSANIVKNVIIKGVVYIGENTIIKDNTIIEGPCFIGDNCEIGYSNVLRGPLNLEKNVKTGAFCQIKHSIVQEGTHIQSGFIGDSIIGKNCRFGAGFISANRRFDRQNVQVEVQGKKVDTGASYFGAVVGQGTHFGIHSGTMPGVLIGKECMIYPGVHVFKNMPDSSMRKTSA